MGFIQIESWLVGTNALTTLLKNSSSEEQTEKQKNLRDACYKEALRYGCTTIGHTKYMRTRIIFNLKGEWTEEVYADRGYTVTQGDIDRIRK